MSTYDDIRAAYHVDVPETFNFADDVIDRHADSHDKLALLWVDDHGALEERTFSQISAASKRLANALVSKGLESGDTTILILGREIAWWESITALLRLGSVVSPGTTQLAPNDVAYRVGTAEAKCIITNAEGAEKFDAVAGDCPSIALKVLVGGSRDGWLSFDELIQNAPEKWQPRETGSAEEAMCYFTSGTTGYPKMTIHAHGYALAHKATGAYWLDLAPEDIHWNISDTGWAKAAWSSYFAPWIIGATIFVHHAQGFSAARCLELLQKHPISTMCGAPTIYRMFVQQDLERYRFEALRHCVAAGEPLNPEIISSWERATGITIRDGYGQTETVLLCGNYPFLDVKPGSMGRPAPGIDLAVIDSKGGAVTGEEGDIAVRVKPEPPPGLFLGYRGEPEKTAQCFVGEWYITGDRARVDEDGYFWFVSRSDDVILSSGYRIGPFEVESALLEHAAVAESAVVASPDSQRGEVVKAFVVLGSGHEPSDALAAEIKEHVKQVTAPYKYPRKLEFVEELPKTVSGKIRRVELRDREWRQEQKGD